MQLFTAVYDNRHGTDVRVFGSHEEVEAWRQEIADEFWDQEMDERPKPKDREEMADAYFEEMGNCFGRHDWFESTEQTAPEDFIKVIQAPVIAKAKELLQQAKDDASTEHEKWCVDCVTKYFEEAFEDN